MEPFSEANQDRQRAIKRVHRIIGVTMIFLPTLALLLLLVLLVTVFLVFVTGRSFVLDLLVSAALVLPSLLGVASFVQRLTASVARAHISLALFGSDAALTGDAAGGT